MNFKRNVEGSDQYDDCPNEMHMGILLREGAEAVRNCKHQGRNPFDEPAGHSVGMSCI
jgi:hypothetical protein